MGDVVSENNQVNYIEGLSPFDEIYGSMIERSGRQYTYSKLYEDLNEPVDEQVLRQEIVDNYSPKPEDQDLSMGQDEKYQTTRQVEQLTDAVLSSLGIDAAKLANSQSKHLKAAT